MKYLVVLGDGMADYAINELDGKTPLQVANKPNMDRLANLGQTGMVCTVPKGFSPGSDVANLSVIGYPPHLFYTGRSPLEAISMGIAMDDDDFALRCNLVTIVDGVMVDYSAGAISTEESKILISAVANKLNNNLYRFYSGISYRHCMICKDKSFEAILTPPHDIMGKKINEYLPRGASAEGLLALYKAANKILINHPINQTRIANDKHPATDIWLWGAGKKAKLQDFYQRTGLKGSVVSAVDLLKGIAVAANMNAPTVIGATGELNTNIDGKIAAVKDQFENGADYVYLHIEAPDECGHQGHLQDKIKAIEMVDYALKCLWDYLAAKNEDYVISLLPDHATPLSLRTHTCDPVPYVVYNSKQALNSGLKYNELDAKKGKLLSDGQDIIKLMLS